MNRGEPGAGMAWRQFRSGIRNTRAACRGDVEGIGARLGGSGGLERARQAHRRAAEHRKAAQPVPGGEVVGDLRPLGAHHNVQRQAAARAATGVTRPFSIRAQFVSPPAAFAQAAFGRPWGQERDAQKNTYPEQTGNAVPERLDILASQRRRNAAVSLLDGCGRLLLRRRAKGKVCPTQTP